MHIRTERHERRRARHAQRGHGRQAMPGRHRLFSDSRNGRAVRRGNVRAAILSVLADRPMHGYQVIQELETRTQGRWRPSAGSVYPTLQLLEDEGLLSSEEIDGRRTYALTDAGRQAAEQSRGLLEADASGEPDLRKVAMSVIAAAKQVQRIGTAQDAKAAREILSDARRRLYRLLAEEDSSA
jgi:DNA-binding PadR family transcriptional regulator